MKKKLLMAVMAVFVLNACPVYADGLELMAGQTVVEDMSWPSGRQIEEAERYLSENRIEITDEVRELCGIYGRRYGISPELLQAMIWTESRCIPSAQSPDKSCKGLMQVKPSCHHERMKRLGVRNVFDPAGNILVGTDYLAELIVKHDALEAALGAYNGDAGAAEGRYVSWYAKKVLEISQALERADVK